jgi:hypothetical protein
MLGRATGIKFQVENLPGKRPHRESMGILEDNIKMPFYGKHVKWTELAQDGIQWRVLVDMMKVWVP